MKKCIIILLTIALLCAVFAGCGEHKQTDNTLSIVATIFPEYDWTRQILGDQDANLTLLLDNGADLHNYQPTAKDMITISNCDVFLYAGGESDEWVEDALADATNKNMVTVNLLEVMGDRAKEEEIVEGMEAEEEAEYDEHVWLSLKNAKLLTNAICDALCKVDADHAEDYRANAAAYAQKLDELDGKYADAVSKAARKTVLFGDRFPFRYLVDDYGLTYYAAFVGCSAETEASFETVAFLSEKVKELQLPVVLTLEGSDQRIAQTILSTAGSNASILSLDSLQTTTDLTQSYLSIMEHNLTVLTQALN